MSSIAISIDNKNDTRGVLMKISGDLDMYNAEKLDSAFLPLLAQHPSLVVLDLADLRMISSLGMGSLLSFRKGMQRHGGVVFVANVPPVVLDAFARARLVEVLNVRGTTAAAFRDGAEQIALSATPQ